VDGGNCSNTKDKTSRTYRTTKSSMFKVEETEKDKMSWFMVDTIKSTRDGKSSMSEIKEKQKPRDLTKTSDLKSIDHSTLCPDYQ